MDPRTPRKPPPPFQRRVALRDAVPSSPRVHATQHISNNLPVGNKLLIRGVYEAEATVHDPVALIRALTDRLVVEQPESFLPDIPVIVSPFSDRDVHPSACYLSLDPILTQSVTDEPRCDLLTIWGEALVKAMPLLEVVWAPAADGMDKRMWLRLPNAVQVASEERLREKDVSKLRKEIDVAEATKLIHSALTAQKIHVARSFPSKGGPIIDLVLPAQLDRLLIQRTLLVSKLSTMPISLYGGKQIDILHAFELVITGIGRWDGIALILEEWLQDNFSDDDGPLLVDYRIPPKATDTFVFYMRDWASTRAVLEKRDEFVSSFQSFAHVNPPELLFNYNSKPPPTRITTRDALADGAAQVATALSGFNQRFDDVHKAQRDLETQMILQTRKIENVETTMGVLSSGLKQISDQQLNQQMAIAAIQQEAAQNVKRSTLESTEYSLRTQLMFLTEPQEIAVAKEQLEWINKQKAELDSSRGITAGPSAPLLPPPPLPASPPGLPATPQRNSFSLPSPRDGSHSSRHRRSASPDHTNKKGRMSTPKTPTPATNRRRSTRISTSEDLELLEGTRQPDDGAPANGEDTVRQTKALSITASLTAAVLNDSGDVIIPKLLLRFARGPDGTRGFTERKRLNINRVVEKVATPSCFLPSISNCVPSVSYSPFKSVLLGLLLVLLTLVVETQAATQHSAFSIYALNANGLVHSVKMAHISNVIKARNPHAFILGESKTYTSTAKNLPYSDYEVLEEKGVRSTNHHLYKWGIVMGIRKDVQLLQRLQITDEALRGRVIAADIALSTSDGRAYTHRVIGAYAPWNPGTSETDRFWPALTELCLQTNSSWSISGDLNTTVSSSERTNGGTAGAAATMQFKTFLEAVGGLDLWSTQEERSRLYDWTCRSRSADPSGGTIIDRIVTSRSTLLDSHIEVADRSSDFVPNTDHRAVVGTLIHRPPVGGASTLLLPHPIAFNKARIKFPPNSEKHRHDTFRTLTDARSRQKGLGEIFVNDEDSFLHLYDEFGKVLIKSAEEAYGRVRRYQKREQLVTNEKIQKSVSRVHSLGSVIRFLRGNTDTAMSHSALIVYARLTSQYRSNTGSLTLLEFAVRTRRSAYQQLYMEKADEIKLRAQKRDRNQIIGSLMGGSTKKLVSSGNFVPMPLVLKKLDSDELVSDPAGVKEISRQYWSRLYHHQPDPDIPKPWMTTKSVKEAHDRVRDDPFDWPRPAPLADFRAMLRKGSNRPSPGPDEWEKWLIKNLSDETLSIVLRLHNYIVMTSTFPV